MSTPTARRPRGRALVVFAAVPTLTLTGCFASSEGDESDGTVIRLALNNTASSLPAVVAEEQGFFADEGLDVRSTVLADITRIPPALGNQFEIGFGVQPLIIRGADEGLDTVVVSGNGLTSEESPEVVLMASEESGITSVEDMDGARLAAPTLTGNLHLGTLYWLDENGVDPDAVDDVQVAAPAMLDQLEQGEVDVAEVQQPYIALAEEQGMVEVDYPLSAVNDPVGMSSWISGGSWADENEDTIMRFRSALDEASAWIEENEDEAKETLADHTEQSPDLVDAAPLPEFTTDVEPDDLGVWEPVLREVAGFEGEVDPDTLVAYPTS